MMRTERIVTLSKNVMNAEGFESASTANAPSNRMKITLTAMETMYPILLRFHTPNAAPTKRAKNGSSMKMNDGSKQLIQGFPIIADAVQPHLHRLRMQRSFMRELPEPR